MHSEKKTRSLSRFKLDGEFDRGRTQSGLPDGIFLQTKNPNLGKFSNALEWNVSAYFTAILYTFGNLVYYMAILVSFAANWRFFTVWFCCAKKNLATLDLIPID
jgi:hypothetical protein